jgi:hypothetical protein
MSSSVKAALTANASTVKARIKIKILSWVIFYSLVGEFRLFASAASLGWMRSIKNPVGQRNRQ